MTHEKFAQNSGQVTEVTAAELSRDVDSDSEDVAAERFIGAAVHWEEMIGKWWRNDGEMMENHRKMVV